MARSQVSAEEVRRSPPGWRASERTRGLADRRLVGLDLKPAIVAQDAERKGVIGIVQRRGDAVEKLVAQRLDDIAVAFRGGVGHGELGHHLALKRGRAAVARRPVNVVRRCP
jgi:hypothetical protein